MARPNCPEDVCNISLDYLKQQPLNNISSPTSNSEYIFSRWYDLKRQAALRAHPWKFAIKRTTLTPTVTPPEFGYAYAYNLPNDYIRKVSVGNDYDGNLKQKIEIEGGQILAAGGSDAEWNPLAPAETLYLRYIYDCTSVAAMDPLFISFFALGMAIELSPKFSVAATAVDRLMKTFETIDCEARTVNGQDSPPKRIQESKRLARRRGYQSSMFAGAYTVFGS